MKQDSSRHLTCVALPASVLLGLALAAAARGQEAELKLVKASAGDVQVEALPDAAFDTWHLYRGELAMMSRYEQRGDPQGRCDLGTTLSVTLAGELGDATAYYYLASLVVGGVEHTLGSGGVGERTNTFPCPGPAACGTEIIGPSDIGGTEGIAIAPDGTVYYSQTAAIGRKRPGAAPEPAWVATSSRVFGLALRADGMLFACVSGATDEVVIVDTTLPAPTARRLFSEPGFPNGIILDASGVAIYGDFSNDAIYRLTDAGVRTLLTASPIDSVNGLLLDDDGSLLALAYRTGEIWRLELDAMGVEVARSLAGAVAGRAPDGIGKDELGRYYVTDNAGGTLIRLDATFGSPELVAMGLPAAANFAFGRGSLDCTDIYITSSGSLGRVNVGVTGRP